MQGQYHLINNYMMVIHVVNFNVVVLLLLYLWLCDSWVKTVDMV